MYGDPPPPGSEPPPRPPEPPGSDAPGWGAPPPYPGAASAYPGAPPPYPGGPPPYPGTKPRTNTLAIISLVAGIAQFACVPVIGTITAIVTGHVARGQIRRANGAEGGSGFATAGTVLGSGGRVLGVLAVVGLVVFRADIQQFSMRQEAEDFVDSAEETSIRTGRPIRDAEVLQAAFREELAGGDYDAQLVDGPGLLFASADDWERAGWRFEMRGDGLDDVYICVQVPRDVGFGADIDDGRCARSPG